MKNRLKRIMIISIIFCILLFIVFCVISNMNADTKYRIYTDLSENESIVLSEKAKAEIFTSNGKGTIQFSVRLYNITENSIEAQIKFKARNSGKYGWTDVVTSFEEITIPAKSEKTVVNTTSRIYSDYSEVSDIVVYCQLGDSLISLNLHHYELYDGDYFVAQNIICYLFVFSLVWMGFSIYFYSKSKKDDNLKAINNIDVANFSQTSNAKELQTSENEHNYMIENINKEIEVLLSNTDLIKMIRSYLTQNSVNLWSLEFAFLPISYNGFDKYKLFKIREGNSEYLRQLRVYPEDVVLNNYYTDIADAYKIVHIGSGNLDIQLKYLSDGYNKLKELYNLFVNQNIISKNGSVEKFQAFLFVVYMQKKIVFSNYWLKELKSNGLDESNSENEIIDRLFENGYGKEDVTNILWSKGCKESNYLLLINFTYQPIETRVSEAYKNFVEKKKISELLNADNDKITYSINDIDLYSGGQFEDFVTYMFNRLGYKATRTKASGDQGVDVVAKRGDVVIAIQTKCYGFGKNVSNKAVQEVVAGGVLYDATKFMVITNRYFTKGAVLVAKAHNVELWDRETLKEKLKQIK